MKLPAGFQNKLLHNYHELTGLEKIIYRLFIRRTFSPQKRFFFEGILALPGQMYTADRQALYEAILQFAPRYCLEIGTWTGGGSTYFIAKAFETLNKNGKLYTLEADDELFEKARGFYRGRLASTSRFVEFLCGADIGCFRKIIQSYGGLDCCFLDGAEDSNETIAQYEFLKPFFRCGTILMAHDWNTEKMAKLKPLLLGDAQWALVKKIDPPESVGFVIFKHE